MAKPAFVYISTDPYRNLTLGVTKDLDVEAFTQENASDLPVKIVFSEEHASIKEALARVKQLTKMSKKARARFITRVNPSWKDLAPIYVVPRPWDDGALPGEEGGVGARVPRPPVRPLVAADAKAWPIEAD
jgi:predicted GIY-YIG superfamily endonuclease